MSYYQIEDVDREAKGRWLDVLEALAPLLQSALLKVGKHVPCPHHGGRDGFRLFKNATETGGGICNTCGAYPNGFKLLMWLNNWSFRQCLEAVGDYLCVQKQLTKKERHSIPHAQCINQGDRSKPNSYTNHWVCREPMNGATEGEAVSNLKKQIQPSQTAPKEKIEKRGQPQASYEVWGHEKIAKVWDKCLPYSFESCGPMRKYFHRRGLFFDTAIIRQTDSLRYHPNLDYFEGEKKIGQFPAMVCAIRDVNGKLITLHRTYLTGGGRKAYVQDVKKMMPVPKGLTLTGAAIPLGEPTGGVLGVAEGLETALSVFRITKIPTWSTVNAHMMENFEAPPSVKTVLIWADKDLSHTGEISANILAKRLEAQGIRVFVISPHDPIPYKAKGVDWNDVLLDRGMMGFPSIQQLRTKIYYQTGSGMSRFASL